MPMLKERNLTPFQGLLHAIWTDERISSVCVSMRNTDQSARTPTPPAVTSRSRRPTSGSCATPSSPRPDPLRRLRRPLLQGRRHDCRARQPHPVPDLPRVPRRPRRPRSTPRSPPRPATGPAPTSTPPAPPARATSTSPDCCPKSTAAWRSTAFPSSPARRSGGRGGRRWGLRSATPFEHRHHLVADALDALAGGVADVVHRKARRLRPEPQGQVVLGHAEEGVGHAQHPVARDPGPSGRPRPRPQRPPRPSTRPSGRRRRPP